MDQAALFHLAMFASLSAVQLLMFTELEKVCIFFN